MQVWLAANPGLAQLYLDGFAIHAAQDEMLHADEVGANGIGHHWVDGDAAQVEAFHDALEAPFVVVNAMAHRRSWTKRKPISEHGAAIYYSANIPRCSSLHLVLP